MQDKVKDVTFSDPTLLRVDATEDGTDWLLTSLKPFTTEEVLTISQTDGHTFVIRVTDAQTTTELNNVLKDVTLTLNGEVVEHNDNVPAKDGDIFTLSLTFQENDNWQFMDNDTTMVYHLPEGITLGDVSFSGKFLIDLGLDGTLSGNTYTYNPVTRQIEFNWNTNSTQFDALTDAANAGFTINVAGQFTFTTNEISFKDDYEFTVTHEDPHKAEINKTGQYYPANSAENPYPYPAIKYTVTVVSDGTTENLNIVDTVKGTALTLIPDSAVVSSDKENSTIGTPSIADKQMTLHIGAMQDKETVTITYWAQVNLDEIAQSGNATITEAGNTVKVTHKDGEDEHDNVVHEINFSDFSKTAVNVSESTTNPETGKTTQTIMWEIVTNSTAGKSIAGSTVTDKIADVSKDRMSYSGEGISVYLYNADGTLAGVRPITWSEIGVDTLTG